jgi:hypothetical protein
MSKTSGDKKFVLLPWSETLDRIPPIVGYPDPIYAPMKAEAYRACRTFYAQAEAYLNGASEPPDIRSVLKAAIPHGSILEAELSEADDGLGPKVLAKIEDLDRPFEKDERSPRWFDPEYFPAVLMLTYVGGSLRFDDKRRKKDDQGNPTEPNLRRMIVSFGRGTDGNISILRVITDAPPGYQVHRINARTDKNYHYEYRRRALALRSDDRVRDDGRLTKTARRGRRHAIQLAGNHFDRAIAKGEVLADLSLDRVQYEELLQEMFRVADELHDALKKSREAPRAVDADV